MTEQAALFQTDEPLNPRQQAVLDLVNAHPDGVTADEAGAAAHAIPGPRGGRTHPTDQRCKWCAKEGKRILDVLVDQGHVRRRQSREPGQTGYRYFSASGSSTSSGGGETGTVGRPGFDEHGLPEHF